MAARRRPRASATKHLQVLRNVLYRLNPQSLRTIHVWCGLFALYSRVWQRVQSFPGVASSDVTRYRIARSLGR